MTAISRKKDENAMAFFALGMLMWLPMAAWAGFVISTLWGWFAQPLGLVHIGVWEAAGLSLLIHLLVMDHTVTRDSDKSSLERLGEAISYGLIVPAFFLGFGAIYHAL